MAAVRPVLGPGSSFLDLRGESRALRVSWHHEAGAAVLSVWRDNVCTATVRLAPDQVAGLVEALAAGLTEELGEGRLNGRSGSIGMSDAV
jgi:hypothetical protein